MRIEFTVPAVPVAQPRPRATAINGQARMYEAASTHPVHAFKASVRSEAQRVYSGPPLGCALQVELVFVMPRPKSLMFKSKPTPRLPATSTRNDVDNLAKACLDALNKTTYVDDGQVCRLEVSKWIAAGDEQPHVEVKIQELQ